MRVVLPSEGDVVVVHRQEAMIGDRHAMGVAGQVLQHVFRPAEGCLGVDHPVLPKQRAQERGECLLVRQRLALAVESQVASGERPAQSGHELTAKDAAEHSHRQEEVGRRSRSTAHGPATVRRRARRSGCADGAAKSGPRYAEC